MIKNRLTIALLCIKLTLFGSFLAVVFVGHYIGNHSRDRLYSEVRELPRREVAVLLGTSRFLSSGEPNPYFEHRVDAAAELYHNGRVSRILASGDRRHASYNEPAAMRDALLARRVPDSAIMMDYGGLSTLDSVARVKHVYDLDDVVIVSQRFHNERALYIASEYELSAIGYNAQDVSRLWGARTELREYLARVKALLDLHVFHTAPLLDAGEEQTGEE